MFRFLKLLWWSISISTTPKLYISAFLVQPVSLVLVVGIGSIMQFFWRSLQSRSWTYPSPQRMSLGIPPSASCCPPTLYIQTTLVFFTSVYACSHFKGFYRNGIYQDVFFFVWLSFTWHNYFLSIMLSFLLLIWLY